MEDLALISGDFFYDDCLPKERRWLLNYYKSSLQRRFIMYIEKFPDLKKRPFRFYRCFKEHTGRRCGDKSLRNLCKNLTILEKLVESALQSMDLEKLELVKSGRYQIDLYG